MTDSRPYLDAERIDPNAFYRVCDIINQRLLNISKPTLYRWIKSGRLIPCPNNPSLFRGDFILAAAKNKKGDK